jgi:hypothetical protein
MLVPLLGFSQTNILDSNIAYDALTEQRTLSVFLSAGDGVSSLNVKLGSSYSTGNILNSTYTVGTNIPITDNILRLPVTLSAGDCFVTVTITRTDAITHVVEYKYTL